MNSFYNDVNPHMLNNFRTLDDIHGHTYFVPIGYNVMSMWYNRKLFKEFNVPSAGARLDLGRVRLGGHEDRIRLPTAYGFAIGSPRTGPFTDVYPWVLTNGGYILNPAQSTVCAGSAASIEAATFVRSLVSKKLVNEPGGLLQRLCPGVTPAVWACSEAVCGPTSASVPPRSSVNETFAIVPWPKSTHQWYPRRRRRFPHVRVVSKTRRPCGSSSSSRVSDEFQRGPVVPFGGDMPIRHSVGTDPAFLTQWPQGTHYFTDELAYSTLIVGVPNATAVESEISNAWESILTGAGKPRGRDEEHAEPVQHVDGTKGQARSQTGQWPAM